MVKTKQTRCGGSSQIPAGMQVVTYGEALEADQDIPEEDWPDVDNPLCTAAQQAAQTSKPTGETGKGSTAVGIHPTANPQPQASTSTGATQAPTTDLPQSPPQPQDPTNNPHNPKPVPVQLTPRTPPKILKRKKIQPS